MAELKLYLLGPPYVTWNGSVMDIPRRQVRVLLYFLATYPNAIPKERLHYLLWYDKPEAVCRRNLSHLLTHLRGVLPDESILVVQNSLVMLDHDKIWCDVVEFKNLLHASKEHERYEAFQRATELYRGSFLDGKPLPGGREIELLIERERFYLERNYLNLLYKLILIEKRHEDFEKAIEYAYQYLAIDNLSEEVHRQLISLYGFTGQRDRALAQYKICEELLMDELQAKPSRKTQAACQNAISDKLPETKKATIRGVVTDIRPVKDSPIFINKDNLAEIKHHLQSGTGNFWGALLIHGEVGIGKANLITKYLEDSRPENLILRTKCNPGSSSIRYWPIRQICIQASKSEHHTLHMNPDLLDEIKKDVLLISDTYDQPDNVSSSDAYTKERNFTIFIKTIFTLSELTNGLIVCIEDLEWADEDTLDLVLYLCNRLREKKILILGSYCCEGRKQLKKFIHSVQLADDFIGIMDMRGIDLDTSLAIQKYWLGDFEGAQALAENLHRVSGGNPLFLTETLRWILDAKISVSDLLQNGNIPLPASISKTIGFRLNQLNEIDVKILEIAAIIGYSFNFDQIIALSEFSTLQVVDALDKMVVRHFLENHSSNYQFRHELIYQFVLDKMSPARRQVLERTLSEALSN